MRKLAVIAALLFATLLFMANTSSASAEALTPETKKEVEIKPGDTLSGIAIEHQTTYVRLFDANTNIKDPDIIFPGEKLRIPRPDEHLESRVAPVDTPALAPVVQSPAAPNSAPRQRAAQTTPVAAAPAPSSASSGVWDQLAACESGGNWSTNTGNGYYGGLQFSQSSWQAVGGTGLPSQASKSEQIARAEMLQARQGWGAWPACTSKLGIR